jgi:hypothetical protein
VAGEALGRGDEAEFLSEPEQVAAAVYAHYVLQRLSKLPLPESSVPEHVLDVAHTVMNHTGLPPDVVADYVPEIRGFMSELFEAFSQLNDT